MAQLRVIEKRGLIKFDIEERRQLVLWVVCRVVQRPNSGYVSVKYPRDKGFYGGYQLMANGYVVKTGAIEYFNQHIYYHHRDSDQAAEALACYHQHNRNFYSDISLRVQIPLVFLFSDSGEPPLILGHIDSILFKLVDGCILEVESGGMAFQNCILQEGGEEEEPPIPPPPSGSPPPLAPPPGSPPNTGNPGSGADWEISPPYDDQDDNGDTYVPPFTPPWQGDPGQNEGNLYDVEVAFKYYNEQGQQVGSEAREWYYRLTGKIKGLGSLQPQNTDAPYGILHGQGQIRSLGSNYQFRTSVQEYYTGYGIARIARVQLSP